MKKHILLLITFFWLNMAFAQQPFRHMTTLEVHKQLIETHPEINDERRLIEQFTAGYGGQNDEILTIPIVFHIVYANTGEIVTEDQVNSQIDALNRDFRNIDYQSQHPADALEGFSQRVADCQIEFCFSSISPQINYVPTTVAAWDDNDLVKSSSTGGADVVSSGSVLNIWVCNIDGLSGYAQMPGGPATTDGIVIDYQFFGTNGTAVAPFDEGKTLTHLVGNYLNLFPLWGEYQCGDDYVDDTPIHNGPNYGCPGYKHISACSGNQVEMVMNFMDNTNDDCMYMFTNGQRKRMRAVLAEGGVRHDLVSGFTNCEEDQQSLIVPTQSGIETEIDELKANHLLVQVIPNPVSKEINLFISVEEEGSAIVLIINSLGQKVKEIKNDLGLGINNLKIDCQDWQDGIYFLTVRQGLNTIAEQFVVANR